MARPIKQGLDYFPLDVDCDDKIELLEAKHGVIGFAVLIKLWQKIYKNGYYIDWNEEILLLFKKQINVDINLISDIVKDCIRWKIFNEQLFKKYSILTSTGIQKRYIAAVDRRSAIVVYREYFLIGSENNNINLINVYNNSINDDMMSAETELLESKSTQSRVKESRVKESRVKQFIPPSILEIQAYCIERKNDVDPRKFFDYFDASGWIDSKGTPVKNWKQKIITWEKNTNSTVPIYDKQNETKTGGTF